MFAESPNVCRRILHGRKEGSRKLYRFYDVRNQRFHFFHCLTAANRNISSTELQLSSHIRSKVAVKISPELDMAKFSENIPRSLSSAILEPILYEHGQVGMCNDLIFGMSLVDYEAAKDLQEGEVPKIIRICIEEVDRRGLDSEGIYRVCCFFCIWLP